MARRLFGFFQRTSSSAPEREVKAVYNMATAFSAWDRHEKALTWYQRALAVDPGHAGGHYGRAASLAALSRHEEAVSGFERALALRPEFLNAHYGCAVALTALNRHAEAIAHFDWVLAREPDHVDANYGRGLCLLASGELPAGFAGLEYRDRLPSWNKYVVKFSSPPWWGDESLAGKTILLYPDGGLGDAVQFVRYVPMLAERGARVVLRVPDKLQSLLTGMPGVAEVMADFGPVPAHDFHCPMIRLPLVFGTTLDTIPAFGRYLRADPARVEAWAQRLGPRRRPRIGIAWAGSHLNRGYNGRRSVPLEALRPLADLGCDLFSLQHPVPRHDRAAYRSMPRLNRLRESFSETAAVIENLDLVIAIDSAIAHLAGSLGKPVWLLLCHAAEWRWLTDRTDSPWYPTARLFRQSAPGHWDGVIADVKRAWPQWVREQSSGPVDIEEGALSISG